MRAYAAVGSAASSRFSNGVPSGSRRVERFVGVVAATQMRPGVIVMDVTMPVLDGIEATRLLKARDATRSARVIAYTANASIDSPLAEMLFAAVLQKPSPPEVVLATVRHVAGLYDA